MLVEIHHVIPVHLLATVAMPQQTTALFVLTTINSMEVEYVTPAPLINGVWDMTLAHNATFNVLNVQDQQQDVQVVLLVIGTIPIYAQFVMDHATDAQLQLISASTALMDTFMLVTATVLAVSPAFLINLVIGIQQHVNHVLLNAQHAR